MATPRLLPSVLIEQARAIAVWLKNPDSIVDALNSKSQEKNQRQLRLLPKYDTFPEIFFVDNESKYVSAVKISWDAWIWWR